MYLSENLSLCILADIVLSKCIKLADITVNIYADQFLQANNLVVQV